MAFFGQRSPRAEPQGRPSAAGQSPLLDQMNPLGSAQRGGREGYMALSQPIGTRQVREAYQTLQEYKAGKASLEQKIIENEQWYKLRHWDYLRKENKQEVEPTSAWLFNCLANKHADAMDNFPSPNILPREEGDKAEAEMLTSIVPVVYDQCDFEQTYSDEWDDKLNGGTGVYGTFWEPNADNGLGAIVIENIDVLNVFWEPGVTDIQKSRNFFHVELWDNDILEESYPEVAGKLGSGSVDLSHYVYDDNVDTSKKSCVVDWYYKKNQNGRQVLHLCKFVNEQVLFATENEVKYANEGWYHHGRYPFTFDPLFRMKGSPCGFGYIDVAKSAQEYIDRGNQAILKNMLANAGPRHFVRNDGGVNEEEYADMSKDFVHVEGSMDGILPIQGKPLSGIYVQVIKDKVDELKETTGNRDIATGGTSSGVTAASAIAAMQEAGSKLSRDHIKASYRVYRDVTAQVVELIRQFWDLPRCFRIMGENGAARYVQYSNRNIQAQHQGFMMGVDMGYRVPAFDIEITAQRQSPYSRMSQNELAMQFFGAGFFNPQMADQAMATLDMMDFDRKEFIMQKIAQNGGMFQQMQAMQQQMLMLAQMVDQSRGSNLAQQLAAQMGGGPPVAPVDGSPQKATEEEGGESGVTKNARMRVAASTSPR